MRVSLGFAVAAFLTPDILIIDEILAVGDAEFQKKAVDRIKSINNDEERTIFFVSHNLEIDMGWFKGFFLKKKVPSLIVQFRGYKHLSLAICKYEILVIVRHLRIFIV